VIALDAVPLEHLFRVQTCKIHAFSFNGVTVHAFARIIMVVIKIGERITKIQHHIMILFETQLEKGVLRIALRLEAAGCRASRFGLYSHVGLLYILGCILGRRRGCRLNVYGMFVQRLRHAVHWLIHCSLHYV